MAIAADPSPSRKPRLLICFDDGYASVFELAAPILRSLAVPWCLFINPRFVGNGALSVDNLVAYIANVHGLEPLSRAAGRSIQTVHDFIRGYLAQMPPDERRRIMGEMAAGFGIDAVGLACASRLYVD